MNERGQSGTIPHMTGVLDFLRRRKQFENEFFSCPGSKKTVLVTSYIWWTDLIAYAMLRLGYNVLVAEPFYYLYLDDARWASFDSIYKQWLDTIRKLNVSAIIGGNSTGILAHPQTRKLLHRDAGIPLVNYIWDEPRSLPPMSKRGFTAADHLAHLRDEKTLNVFWDIDVLEEMQTYFGVTGMHLPLAATPELWQSANIPSAQRQTKVCFLGNNHDEGGWQETTNPDLMAWAQRATAEKIANLDAPMVQCISRAGAIGDANKMYSVAADLKDEFARWNILGAVMLTERRNRIVRALADRLGQEFVIVGKGWDRMGLTAAREHSGVPAGREFYSGARASLNLFGGCVHGGMPLRPYEIAASSGLVFTQYNRELPNLFVPDAECLAFGNVEQMNAQLDRVLGAPKEMDAIIDAGRRRVLAEHTWEKRMGRVMEELKTRFG